MMNTKQRGGGCCSVMSVMTVVMNKRVTGVLCGAENSLRHEEREASKHEIREEAVMQLSAPMALGGEVCVCVWGSSPCDRAENTEAGPPPSPHVALSFVHTILQLHHTPDEPFVSYVTSTLAASTAAHHTFRTAAVFTYLYFLFGVQVHYNTVTPNPIENFFWWISKLTFVFHTSVASIPIILWTHILQNGVCFLRFVDLILL